MSRSFAILFLLAGCLAVVLAAMAWVTVVAVNADRRDAQAQRQAELAENARLALWRMDSALAPLLAREDARPYSDYASFSAPPLALGENDQPLPQGKVVVPSPLLLQPAAFVRLHFQIDPAGRLTSPQVPESPLPDGPLARWREEAQAAAAAADLAVLAKQLDRHALLALTPEPIRDAIHGRPRIGAVPSLSDERMAPRSLPWWDGTNAESGNRQSEAPLPERQVGRARNAPAQQRLRSHLEYQQRVENTLQTALLNKWSRGRLSGGDPDAERAGRAAAVAGEPAVREGELRAVWVEGRLLLLRRVVSGREPWLQGCWLDWEAIRGWLLQRVSDLLPHAELVPAEGPLGRGAGGSPFLLAALPVRLLPGEIDGQEEAVSWPIRTSLLVAWACTLLAVVSVAALAIGMAALSERRAAFVSAVTHELRTPLTTFRLYTHMLAEGMVTGDPQRREYLATLRAEADRLAQLVENVLAYARLERRRGRMSAEETTVGAVVDRFAERLRARARQAKMLLAVDWDANTREARLRTNAAAVEQIVFNLVDNACKYASQAEDRRIQLSVAAGPREVRVSVSDHGPGIGNDVAGRLFRPFCKSAKAAADSAHGVGLGLALSSRLARSLGGRLQLARSDAGGCRFELLLPRLAEPSAPQKTIA